jgi:3-oxoacyl-[acyl-carrier-protein] synthase II
MDRRVAVTGLGVVSSLGFEIGEFWENIKNGKNGISLVESFDTTDYPTKVAAEIKNFDVKQYLDPKAAKRMDKFTQYACIAAQKAIDDAKLKMEDEDPFDVGVIIGSGIGGIETWEEQYKIMAAKGPSRVSPFFIPMMIPNMATGRVAIMSGAKGFNECVITACATSTSAIGNAYNAIKRADADVIITGGAEASITPLSFAGFCSARAMTTNNDVNTSCRPFDLNRDGFIMGEGAAVLILEEFEHAKKRGAAIYAEICGFGSTNDAYDIVKPAEDGEGSARAMTNAMRSAGITPDQIDYINTHGTSTPLNDKYETIAIKNAFGDHSYKLAVNSTKSMTGHMLGAAGAIEAIVTILSIKNSFVAPTINFCTPDPECDLDFVPNKGREKTVDYALSNSLGFGGHNACIVIKKYDQQYA